MRVYAFGDFDKPTYRASKPRALWVSLTTYARFCCEKGHRTPRAAAFCGAKQAAAEWEPYPSEEIICA